MPPDPRLSESARMRSVQDPIIPLVGRLIAANPGTISLGQGMVSYGPPPEALEAAASFGGSPEDHRYGPVEGLPALIGAIERKLRLENGIEARAGNAVVVTAGANMAFMNAALAIGDPGAEFILPVPFYFNHEMAVIMAGCRPVPVRTRANYQLDLEAIRDAITPRTRAVVTVSPNNPSGAVYPEPALRELNGLCRERGLYHIHDEAYEYFTYEPARHFSPGAIDGAAAHTVSIFSLSKAYGFASWRVGYMAVPDSLTDAISKIQDTVLICPTAIAQAAAVGALGHGASYCRGFLAGLAGTRQRLLAAIERLGDRCAAPRPDGAFYCLVRVHTEMEPMALVERLIREFRVAVIPGTTFGLLDGCYLRVSYGALDADTVTEGLNRLARGLTALVQPGGLTAGARTPAIAPPAAPSSR